MKETSGHPYITGRTVKAWVTNDQRFMQIIDVRDIFHWNYSVEYEIEFGGLDSIYSSSSLDRCFEFVEAFKKHNPNK